MASVCINNVAMSPEKFLDCPPVQPSHGWLSPSLSFSRDFADGNGKNGGEKSDREGSVMDFADFEFRLNDPVTMMSADELFVDGKLVPLHLVPLQPAAEPELEIRSPDSMHSRCVEKVSGSDHLYSFSPKAPRCSGVLKELLCMKRAQSTDAESQKTVTASSKVSNAKSLKHLLRLNSRSPSIDSNLGFQTLRDTDYESVSISSARASLSSSSSSGADHEDVPRLSLDSDKITPLPMSPCRNRSRARVAKTRSLAFRRPSELSAGGNIAAMRIGLSSTRWASESDLEGHAAFRAGRSSLMLHSSESDDLPSPLKPLMDSPRLNASGKVIFQGLERSSSSPNISNGDPRSRPRGMVRSRSASLMVTPVLNVPFCNLRSTAKPASVSGFGQLFSHPKREKDGSSAAKYSISNSNSFSKTKCEKSVTHGI
ncbi:uncharacterized protein LOC110108541 [Dendrobium catenatum]|uniref:Uncharacterized protein n=1 Tax=Dendrobium catenatum TaxID=906689 RepID=A0A2I0WXC1_9ASPA|nr:uncharacterized protein LOC110108541 [Dendrobium catenatum]PKU80304.1 hypothetical protein MA16_Dca005835 [Dendrobium catenatum]